MNRILSFFETPVAAIRPLVLSRLFLALLAVDIWINFLPVAGRYGIGGFNIAHFDWLNAIQPLPTPAIYITVMTLSSALLWYCAFTGIRRPLMLAACGLFSWGWMMSRLDDFQHHYLISLILLCISFFPQVNPAQIAVSPRSMIPAWAWLMLGTQIAIVYFWTAIAKMDAAWIGGHTIRRIVLGADGNRAGYESLVSLSESGAWPFMAVAAIVIELLLAPGYLYSLGQDHDPSPRRRIIAMATCLFALGLHGSILLMPLRIGWFTCYMMTFSLVFLLPMPALAAIGRVAIQPLAWLERHSKFAAALALLTFTAWAGWQYWLSDLPFQYHLTAGFAHHMAGDPAAAEEQYKQALLRMPTSAPDARIFNNYGQLMAQARRYPEAIKYFSLAARINPADPDPHTNLAHLYRSVGKPSEAIEQYRLAIQLNPRDPENHYALADVLHSENQIDPAITALQEAIKVASDSSELRNTLINLLLSTQRFDQAALELRAAIAQDPQSSSSMNNLAWLLATRPNRTAEQAQEALQLAQKAVKLTANQEPVILATLAESYWAAGQFPQALTAAQQAIEAAQILHLPEVAAQIAPRLEKYRRSAGQ